MNFLVSKKLKVKKYITFSSVIILLVATLYALIVGWGWYGFGSDYYFAYIQGMEWNNPNAKPFDFLGFKVATLVINEFYIGVYIVTFIMTLSTGFLIRECIKFKQSYSLIFFLLIFLIAIHTWPIIMSTSNAMRQGLTMSFMFLTLISSFRKNYYWMIFFSPFAIFMHKSGLFLIVCIFVATFSSELLKTYSHKRKAIINFLFGTFLLISIYYFFDIFIIKEDFVITRIIGGDFRWPFVFIGFVYVVLSFFYKSLLDNSFSLSLYFMSFAILPILMHGLNWQYERFGMIILIPYILSFGFILNKRSYKMYLILSFFLLYLLTIYTGMYSIGLKHYKEVESINKFNF